MSRRASNHDRPDALLPARQLLDVLLQMPPETKRQEYAVLDYQFHAELARQAGNDVLAAMQKTLTDLLASHFIDVPGNPDRRSDSERLHIAVYSAIVDGDPAKARGYRWPRPLRSGAEHGSSEARNGNRQTAIVMLRWPTSLANC